MAIYTKRGDKGQTSFFEKGNTQRVRVDKDSLKVEALGAVDELNSFLGVVKTQTENKFIIFEIEKVQGNLLTIGSKTAGSGLSFSKTKTMYLERIIDEIEGKLPVLKNFVIPGGSVSSGLLQYSRSLARRAERRMVALSKEEKIAPSVLSYLNRLSDFLFMLARKANFDVEIGEEVWIGRKNS